MSGKVPDSVTRVMASIELTDGGFLVDAKLSLRSCGRTSFPAARRGITQTLDEALDRASEYMRGLLGERPAGTNA